MKQMQEYKDRMSIDHESDSWGAFTARFNLIGKMKQLKSLEYPADIMVTIFIGNKHAETSK